MVEGRHSYNETLTGTYALLKDVYSNDLQRQSDSTIFDDTDHPAASLQQPRFLNQQLLSNVTSLRFPVP